ncbi:MAG: hypothetical protein JWO94_2073, partial [Verrucomicrobiaceae bacterium]|nr:hypothetical protein [Verrucomicrobiaceae bacterium]
MKPFTLARTVLAGICPHLKAGMVMVLLLLGFVPAAQATHFRGASVSYTIDSANLLTVTSYSAWQSTLPDTLSGEGGFKVYTGTGGSGLLGTMTTTTTVNPYSSGTELGQGTYNVVKETFTYNLTGRAAGTYYAYTTSGNWVNSVVNRDAAGASWGEEVVIKYNPGVASAGPTMLPATVDIVGRGQLYTQNLNSIDPDGTPVTYQFLAGSLNSAPDYSPATNIPGMSLSVFGGIAIPGSSTATLSLGRYSYKVKVTDASGATAVRDVLLVVQDATGTTANRPPVLASIGPKTISVGSPLTFTVSGTDPDAGQLLTVRAQLLPTGASFPTVPNGPVTGTSSNFSWTPAAGQEGTYYVNFEVDDNATTTLTASELVTITVTGSNHPPVLASVGNKTVANGGTLTFTASATDIDAGQVVSYQLFNAPAGATINSSTGAFSFSPTAGQNNSTFTSVTVRATDNGSPNLFAEESISITVGSGNNPPVVSANLTPTANVGQPFSLVVSATDPDAGQTINLFNSVALPSGAAFTTVSGAGSGAGINSTFTWTPTLADVGIRTLKFRSQDNGTPPLSTEITVSVTVSNLSNDATLSSLTPSAGTLSPAFAAATTVYNLNVEYEFNTITLIPVVAESHATVTINGTAVTSGNASGPLTVNLGASNVFTIVVTAQDGVSQKSYTVNVTRNVTNPGGAYFIFNGSGITLHGSTPLINVGDSMAYSWTINGVAGAATGASPSLTWAQLNALGITAPVSNVPVVLTTTESSSALPSYYPSGVQLSVPVSTVTGGGWTLAYSGLYSVDLPVASILSSISSSTYVMLAARTTGSSTLQLLGAATRPDVLFDEGQTSNTHNANGIEWYYSATYSWGFAQGGDTVTRNQADTASVDGDKRLSWHTGLSDGGYRAGSTTGLNSSNAYERLVYVSNGGLAFNNVTTGSTTLTVLAIPTVVTVAATPVAQTSATLNCTVNGHGTPTTVSFEWGTTAAYGSTATSSPASVTGSLTVPGSAGISSLTPATVYHFRAKGSTAAGPVYGLDQAFTSAGTFTSGNGNAAAGTTPGGASVGNWGSIRSGMVISETGAVAYRAWLALSGTSVTANSFQGIWKSPDGSSASSYLLARTGNPLLDASNTSPPAPDTGGAYFNMLPYNPVINDLGETTFLGFLQAGTGSPVVTNSNDSAIWSELGGTGLHKILREGEAITGGTVAALPPSAWIATSDAGHAIFNVKLAGSGSALVRATVTSGTLSLATLLKEGDAAPNIVGSTPATLGTYDSLIGNTNDPRMDNAGNAAFLSLTQPSGSGIFYHAAAGGPGTTTAVARSGETTPGLADTFAGFERPTLAIGSIAFRAFLTTNGQSIWRGNPASPASLTVLAKTGDTTVSGTPPG